LTTSACFAWRGSPSATVCHSGPGPPRPADAYGSSSVSQ
jgi:hypothetical protein